MDNLTAEQRRKNMQNIRSINTKPERMIMDALKKRRIYFAAHVSKIPGKPDIVFRRKKVAVFIDSDFWHGHPERCIMPKTNPEYWSKKIASNRKRDQQVNRELTNNGWTVIRLWEYDIKHNLEGSLEIILKAIGKHED
jgi:DNA mismatch endonuclease (patch repair protein)